MKLPNGVETLEMLDGRLYYSDDNWQTIHLVRDGKVSTVRDKFATDRVRHIVVCQSSAGAS